MQTKREDSRRVKGKEEDRRGEKEAERERQWRTVTEEKQRQGEQERDPERVADWGEAQ